MKILFIESKYKEKITLPKAVVEKLSRTVDKIALFTTVQFLDNIPNIKKQLEKENIAVELIKPVHCKYAGQLLGCSIERFKTDADAFLYIGDGMFHPLALKLSNSSSEAITNNDDKRSNNTDHNNNGSHNCAYNQPVFAFNPFTKKLTEITENETKQIKQQQKAALVKFYSSKEIGVLISTKPGQFEIKKALALKKKFTEKNFYFFIFDTLDFSQLENFPFVECFVNTACRRVSYDDYDKSQKKILDISLLF